MQLRLPEDRREIAGFLSRDAYLNLYSLGDLDERFLPFTRWYGRRSSGSLDAVICIYTGGQAPTLMALTESCGITAYKKLIEELIPLQPDELQAHLSPGLKQLFAENYTVVSEKSHYKMALADPFALRKIDSSAVEQLGEEDIPLLQELYNKSYPGNWFEPEMLPINRYCGIRGNGRLIAAAGTHVFSQEFGAAALGNITVLPEMRGKGLGTAVTAALAKILSNSGIRVGLNVQQDNRAAISSYRRAGFAVKAEYDELIMRRRHNGETSSADN